jgi:hypothetical protein
VTGLAGGAVGAGLSIVGNVGKARFGGLGGGRVDHHEVAGGEVVEQGDHALFEQGQPVLHARKAAPFADRLIERIARGIGAEPLAIAAAEALDRGFVEQGLAGREQQVGFDRLDRALGIGIEQAQRFQLVAKEIEAQPVVEPGRVNVEDRSAHRIFARIDHGIGARIALPLEQRDQALAPDLDAGRKQAGRSRMRNGVSVRWSTALIVVTSRCGVPSRLCCNFCRAASRRALIESAGEARS